MGLLQTAITSVLPRRWAAALEADSRLWTLRCSCGHERSLWDAGGIRYKAAGTKLVGAQCPHCGFKMHRLYKKPSGGPTGLKN